MGLNIKNASGDKAVVDLYGDIGDEWGGITDKQFRQELSAIPSKTPVELHINSGGGSFTQGLGMYNTLKQRKGEVHVVVDGLAASAASLIAMAGKTITMSASSWMMIHEARAGAPVKEGRAADFRETADILDKANAEIVSIYTPRWNRTGEELQAHLASDLYMTASEALDYGLADSISEHLAIAAYADISKFKYKNVPKALLGGEYYLNLERRLCG